MSLNIYIYVLKQSSDKWKLCIITHDIVYKIWFDFLCFNATFSNISAISWQPVLVVEEAEVPNNSYKTITNTAWVRAQFCKLQKGCTRFAVASDKVYQNLQSTTQKTKDRLTRTSLKTRSESSCSGRVSSSCSTCDTLRVTVKRHKHHLIWKSCWRPVYVN
jgi:hypothetical protein